MKSTAKQTIEKITGLCAAPKADTNRTLSTLRFWLCPALGGAVTGKEEESFNKGSSSLNSLLEPSPQQQHRHISDDAAAVDDDLKCNAINRLHTLAGAKDRMDFGGAVIVTTYQRHTNAQRTVSGEALG